VIQLARIFFLSMGLFSAFQLQAENTFCEGASGKVARAMFTTNIDEREPIDRVLILENQISQLYFFSDLRHLEGQTVKHRWEYEGKFIKDKTFVVSGPRWRVYSLHTFDKSMLGRWTVIITDQDNCPLKAVIFQYVQTDQSEGSAIIELR